jgi:hypothetical protein
LEVLVQFLNRHSGRITTSNAPDLTKDLLNFKVTSEMVRGEFLNLQIGQPWAWQTRNCWDFACHVERKHFGRELPRVAVPAALSKRWGLESIDRHPERTAWCEVPDGPGGLVTAADGALVLMPHLCFPAHIGVLKPEARVIHCSEQHDVCCESVLVCGKWAGKVDLLRADCWSRSRSALDNVRMLSVRRPIG